MLTLVMLMMAEELLSELFCIGFSVISIGFSVVGGSS